MEEAAENRKELSHSAHGNGMNECIIVWGSSITCCNVCVHNSEFLLQDQGK